MIPTIVSRASHRTSQTQFRWISFEQPNPHSTVNPFHKKVGALLPKDQAVVDISKSFGISEMKTLLEKCQYEKFRDAIDVLIRSGKHRIPLDTIRIKPPISNPEKILCLGLNYVDHAKESNMAIPTEPVVFSKFNSSILGPDDYVLKPKETNEMDYEAELVVVIGKPGKHIPLKDVSNHIGGFTIGQDISARDWQLRKPGGQWLLGKTFDTFAPIGPAIVSRVSDVNSLNIKCTLNGNVVQQSNTNQMIFKVDYIIHYLSQLMTLKPGDLIFTGTPPGVGFGRNPKLFLKNGDKLITEIDELGSLSCSILDDSDSGTLEIPPTPSEKAKL
jgi:2-keto-4-pentenoate hydratase/2-oxohepta-3-ene-1,7-dioic acid hydratase in catechol pathway